SRLTIGLPLRLV
ncbi:hypothetical protein ECTW00353_4508, partial [Escherichia coli TW00353]